MSTGGFESSSKSFLREVSRAAAWMLRRNVGALNHWWRPISLRGTNPDEDGLRPPLDDRLARMVFDELLRRNLLMPLAVSPDGHPEPAYLMRCDPDGWEKAVADGRRIYGLWRKVKKNWPLMVGTFVLGVISGTATDVLKDWAKAEVEKVTGKPGEQKPAEKDKTTP